MGTLIVVGLTVASSVGTAEAVADGSGGCVTVGLILAVMMTVGVVSTKGRELGVIEASKGIGDAVPHEQRRAARRKRADNNNPLLLGAISLN